MKDLENLRPLDMEELAELDLDEYTAEEIQYLIDCGIIPENFPKEFYNNEFWMDIV